ncbi:MAG: Hint domain-containing protein [Pseudomonadota bacterium]
MADTLFSEDFEDQDAGAIVASIGEFTFRDDNSAVTTGTDGSAGGDFFIVTDGVGEFNSIYEYVNNDGNFLALNDLDSIDDQQTSGDRILTAENIDISGYENLNFSIDVAQAIPDGWDSDTSFKVEVSIDGGPFIDVFAIEGTGTDTGPQVDTNFNGIGDGTEISNSFTTFEAEIAGTGSTMTLQISHLESTFRFEDIAIDNIEIEGDLICLTEGTRVLTEAGLQRVEDLEIGDLVITKDHGAQEVRWIGARALTAAQMRASVQHRPVRISAGALGHGLPERDLLVSPNHRMLLSGWKAEALFGVPAALVAAKDLVNDHSIRVDAAADGVTYVHVLFDRHEIIFAEGAETESFHPHADGLTAVDAAARAELLALFPELEQAGTEVPTAAPVISGCEALLTSKI